MTGPTLSFSSVHSIHVDKERNELVLSLIASSGNRREIRLFGGMLGGLVTGMMAMAAKLRSSAPDKHFDSQVVHLTESRPFTLQDGRSGLALTFDNSLQLNVLIAPNAPAALRGQLIELERLQRGQTPGAKPN